jgi:hypothetical protein
MGWYKNILSAEDLATMIRGKLEKRRQMLTQHDYSRFVLGLLEMDIKRDCQRLLNEQPNGKEVLDTILVNFQ